MNTRAPTGRNTKIATLSRLDLVDLDLSNPEKPRLHVRQPGKGGVIRWLPLPPSLVSPKRPFGAYVRWRLAVETPEPGLWLTRGGGPDRSKPWKRLTPGALRQIPYVVGRQVGVRVSFNRLRHTVATRVGRDRASGLLDAQYLLGHKNVSTTQRYVAVTEEDVRRRTRLAQADLYRGFRSPLRGSEGTAP